VNLAPIELGSPTLVPQTEWPTNEIPWEGGAEPPASAGAQEAALVGPDSGLETLEVSGGKP